METDELLHRVFSDHEGALVTKTVAAKSWVKRDRAFLLNEEETVMDPHQAVQRPSQRGHQGGAERE